MEDCSELWQFPVSEFFSPQPPVTLAVGRPNQRRSNVETLEKLITTNTEVLIVQKARYGVLVPPVAWLLFSIWVVINETSSQYGYVKASRNPPSGSEMLNMIIYAFGTFYVLFKILHNTRNHIAVSTELKSEFASLLGLTIMAVNAYFDHWLFLSYVGMAMIDIAAVIMMVTFLQGKPFALLKLYHKDVQIQKVP